MPETGVDVLNGTVWVGDTVAYATRQGNSSAIHLGVVEQITSRATWNKTFPVLKVRVECETGNWKRSTSLRTIGEMDRVVKVRDGDPAAPVYHGVASIDSVREKLNLPPWGRPGTSEPIVFTADGPIPFSQVPEKLKKVVITKDLDEPTAAG